MHYSISTELRDGVLVADVHGQRSPHEAVVAEAALGTWVQLSSRCHDIGADRLLVHIRLSGLLPTSAIFASAGWLDRIGWDPALRTAIVDHSDQSRRATDFACRMAASRGWHFARFDTAAAALDWLRSPTGGPA